MSWVRRGRIFLLAVVLLAASVRAQDPAREEATASDVVDALLGGLLGFTEISEVELQKEVGELGGIPFKSPVSLNYMTRTELGPYLEEVLDTEYPRRRAEADVRTLVAFGLLEPGTDLRALRARLLAENVAGFYDERPGRKRLYAVSGDRRLTPTNQLVLAHELRHALQDQYIEVHRVVPESIGDYDDRRLAFLSLLEGDATLVMELFLSKRLPTAGDFDLSELSMPAPAALGVPPVVRDQLVMPYVVGRDFARALWKKGGWRAIQESWSQPPESTEQVLHPEKYLTRERPLRVDVGYSPPNGTLLNEGVLGELLVRTLLGDDAKSDAAAGWGGDGFKVWDVSGRTLLVWRTVWDTPDDARECLEALKARYEQAYGRGRLIEGSTVYEKGGWTAAVSAGKDDVVLMASDSAGALLSALRGSTR